MVGQAKKKEKKMIKIKQNKTRAKDKKNLGNKTRTCGIHNQGIEYPNCNFTNGHDGNSNPTY